MVHNKGHNKVSCDLRNKWSMKGFTDTTNEIHQFATIIEFPRNRYKSVKGIAKYLIEKSPSLIDIFQL